MEFKGTKGKWEVGNGEVFRPASNGSISPYWQQICSMVNNGTNEYKANALLISKAPEMLEMLIRMRDNEDWDITDLLDLKQLIKEATELKSE